MSSTYKTKQSSHILLEKYPDKKNLIKNEISKAKKFIAIDNTKEATIILNDLIKRYANNSNSKEKENKIEKEILPVYYLIGKCYIKLKKIQKAKDFLIAAYWNSLKSTNSENKENPEFSNYENSKNNDNSKFSEPAEIAILRHTSFSLLFESEKKYEKSIDEIISAIIISSKIYGISSQKVINLKYCLGILHFKNPKNKIDNQNSLMCFSFYTNFWFEKIKNKIDNFEIKIDNFLDIEEIEFIIVGKNLTALKKILSGFENDQNFLIIKIFFVLVVVFYILSDAEMLNKNLVYLNKYLKTFKDLPLVKDIVKMDLDQYLEKSVV